MISGTLSNAPMNIHLKGHVAHVRQRRSRSTSPKPTIDNSLQGIKKHRQNDLVEEPFVTLEGILRNIPESVPFDVELSMQPFYLKKNIGSNGELTMIKY